MDNSFRQLSEVSSDRPYRPTRNSAGQKPTPLRSRFIAIACRANLGKGNWLMIAA